MRNKLRTYKTNKKILNELSEYNDKFPGVSFSDILVNLGVTCIYHSEGSDHELKFEVIDCSDAPEDQLSRIILNKSLYQ